MAFTPKTNWATNDKFYPADINRLEQGVADATDAVSAVPTVTTGTANPTAAAPDGSTYYQRDATGQYIGQWLRASGAWIQVSGPAPYCALTRSAGFTLTTAVGTAIPWDVETEDDSNMHSTTVNPTRITIAQPGVYTVDAMVEWAGNSTGFRHLYIRLNNSVQIGYTILSGSNGGSGVFRESVRRRRRFVAGDFLEIYGYQSSGGNLDINLTPEYSPIVSVLWERV